MEDCPLLKIIEALCLRTISCLSTTVKCHTIKRMFYINVGLVSFFPQKSNSNMGTFLDEIFNLRTRWINICGFLWEPVETENARPAKEAGRKYFSPRARFVARFITTRLFTIGQPWPLPEGLMNGRFVCLEPFAPIEPREACNPSVKLSPTLGRS